MEATAHMHPLEMPTFILLFVLYVLSLLFFALYSIGNREASAKTAAVFLVLGLIANTVNLVARGFTAGRVPFSNLYESLLIFSWGIAACLLWVIFAWRISIIGTVIMPIIVAMATFAFFLDKGINSLPPALHSAWMTYHVATAIVAYGAFAVSCGLAILYLIRERLEKESSQASILSSIPELKKLDVLIYRVIAFAFPFMGLLIITGAIWAEQAWGQYWIWDPKETWALITLLIYAGFLHARFFLKWRGRPCAIFAIVGFVSVIVCYLGVNLFLSGLHSYGGMK